MNTDFQYDAIYARQSVDRADSISIESQIDICLRETGGDYKVYSDKGYSGKNTDRPGWQALLADVRAGKIKRVITYRLDRISRSVLDFANIIDIFKKYGVSFSSTAERFDTSHPIGNAMLMIVMVFAQLERETIQQRVIDAYRERSEKGFYMGGKIPYGYQLSETLLNGKRTKMYEIVPEEAKVVQMVFDLYSNPQTSFGDIVRELNRLGITNRDGKPINRSRIRDFVCNPVYLKADLSAYEFFANQGVQIYNEPADFIGTNGCYLYSGHTKKRKTINLEGHKLVLAPHEGLIDSYTWLACRKKCLTNCHVAKPLKAKNTWLAGKIKCAHCHFSLAAKVTPRKNKEPYQYFVCHTKYSSGGCDGIGVLYLNQIQDEVFAQIKKKLESFATLHGCNKEPVNTAEKLQLQICIDEKAREIDALINSITSLSGAAIELVNAKINQLTAEQADLQQQINELEQSQKSVNLTAITNYIDLWDEISFDDKRTVVDALIDVIYADKGNLEIHWKI